MDRLPENSIEELFRSYSEDRDSAALTQVFDRSARELFALASHLGHDAAEAEDLVQECFLVAIQKAKRWEPSRPLLPWLVGILARSSAKQRRRSARTLPRDFARSESGPDASRSALDRELRQAVIGALDGMPRRYAELLRLHLLEEVPPRELAEQFGRAPGTVRVQLHRGFELLRRALPSGLALGATATFGPRGLDAVRRVVQEHARTHPVLAASSTSTPLVALAVNTKAALAVLSLVLAGWTALWLSGQREPASGRPAHGPLSERTSESELPSVGLSHAQRTSITPGRPALDPARRSEIASEGGLLAEPDFGPDDPVLFDEQTAWVLRGTVLTEAGEAPRGPVVGFRASPSLGEGMGNRLTAADVRDDGRFRLELPMRIPGHLIAIAEGHTCVTVEAWSDSFEVFAERRAELGTLYLPRGSRLAGRVERAGDLEEGGTVRATVDVQPDTGSPYRGYQLVEGPKLVRRVSTAEWGGDGSFELHGLEAGWSYRVLSFPSEHRHRALEPLQPVGLEVEAPAEGLVLADGMREFTLAVHTAGTPIAGPKLWPTIAPEDLRRDLPVRARGALTLPFLGTPEGEITTLIPNQGVIWVEVTAPGFTSRDLRIDPDALPPDGRLEIELFQGEAPAGLRVRFTGPSSQELERVQVLLIPMGQEQSLDSSGPIRIEGGLASISDLRPGLEEAKLILAQAKRGSDSGYEELPFFRLENRDLFLDPPLAPGEWRELELAFSMGGRIELTLANTAPGGPPPLFELASEDGRIFRPELVTPGDDHPFAKGDPCLLGTWLAPGTYAVRQISPDFGKNEIELRVREREVTRAVFHLSN